MLVSVDRPTFQRADGRGRQQQLVEFVNRFRSGRQTEPHFYLILGDEQLGLQSNDNLRWRYLLSFVHNFLFLGVVAVVSFSSIVPTFV